MVSKNGVVNAATTKVQQNQPSDKPTKIISPNFPL